MLQPPDISARHAAKLRWLLPLLSLVVFGVVLFLLHRALTGFHMRDVLVQLGRVPRSAIAAAMALTCGSYLVLSGYDLLGLRFLRRRVSVAKTVLSSFVAFAVGHNIGLATLTGGAIRLRMYGAVGVPASEVALLVGFCGLTTFLGATFLLAYALLIEPAEAAALLRLSPTIVQSIGAVLALLLTAYFFLVALWSKPIRFGEWSFSLPTPATSVGQLVVAALDLCLAAGALYVLLPQPAPPYATFLAVYVLAIIAGIITNVPGGIGVIESVVLLGVPAARPSALLASLLAFRAIYYLLPLVLASLLLAAHEAWMQRHRLRVAAGAARNWLSVIAPQTLGTLVFVAGAVLLFSGATPALHSRLELLTPIVPLSVLEVSHLLSSIAGLGLVILSRSLFRRVRLAWQLSITLLLASAGFSLLKGFDYEEATIALFTAGLLYLAQSAFYRGATVLDNRFTPKWLLGLSVLVVATVWVGLLTHRHVEYTHELWYTFAFSGNTPRMLRASLVVCVLAGGFVVTNLLSPSRPASDTPREDVTQKAKAIIARAPRSNSCLALLGDKRLLLHPTESAFLMYQISGRSWISMGDPVGSVAQATELAWSFRELSDQHGGRAVFYEVTPDYLPIYIDLGLALLKLGEEARVPLENFSLQGSQRGELRNACRRAEREGARFEVVRAPHLTPQLLQQLRAISDEWLSNKAAGEKRFSVGFFDPTYLANFDIAVVYRDNAPVAFANLWGSGTHEEISIDLMRHSNAAPKLVMDYLFVQLMLWAQQEQYRWFNLGMAPLAGMEQRPLAPVWHRMGSFVFGMGEHFYNFEGLRRYKQKFLPVWEPRYLAAPGGLALPRVLLDVTALIAGGLKEIVAK